MLRHLYGFVLRLHPAVFRKRFGEEMLSIFDQAEGRFAALCLIFDGLVSTFRQWALRQEFWHEIPATNPASAGIPSFSMLAPFRPRSAAVIHGALLSIALFCLTCFAIRYSWIHVLHIHIPEAQFEPSRWAPQSSHNEASSRSHTVSPLHRTQSPPVSSAISHLPIPEHPAVSSNAIQEAGHASAVQRVIEPAKSQATPPRSAALLPEAVTDTKAVAEAEAPPVPDALLDAAARKRVIDGAILNLQRYYIDAALARKMADSIRTHERNGDDDAATDGEPFADLLTTQLRAVSHDRHLGVFYSESTIPQGLAGPTPDAIARYQQEMERTNCTLEKVALLPHNVGYVKLNSFPDLQLCRASVEAAMGTLNQADAIIFDLRDNHGGVPGMVAFLASYLFDHPTHLETFYNRAQNSTLQSWTLSPVDGNNLADKPAFVLTSSGTFSGAEEFAYDLKMLKRATLVGETTAGGAHMVRRRRIDDHFSIGVPDTRPINPISGTDWEGTGVSPDIKVRAADALDVAQSLAENPLQK